MHTATFWLYVYLAVSSGQKELKCKLKNAPKMYLILPVLHVKLCVNPAYSMKMNFLPSSDNRIPYCK